MPVLLLSKTSYHREYPFASWEQLLKPCSFWDMSGKRETLHKAFMLCNSQNTVSGYQWVSSQNPKHCTMQAAMKKVNSIPVRSSKAIDVHVWFTVLIYRLDSAHPHIATGDSVRPKCASCLVCKTELPCTLKEEKFDLYFFCCSPCVFTGTDKISSCKQSYAVSCSFPENPCYKQVRPSVGYNLHSLTQAQNIGELSI